MSLENKDIAELEELAPNLREQIARSPTLLGWSESNWKMFKVG
jgi:hypothetical protein